MNISYQSLFIYANAVRITRRCTVRTVQYIVSFFVFKWMAS